MDPFSNWGIYLHIPFCKSKCAYCDFFSLASDNIPWDSFIDSLKSQFLWLKKKYGSPMFNSLYIGGGTPSLIPFPQIESLFNVFKEMDLNEVTMEVNPSSISVDQLDLYDEIGVNRLSMGIQSFNPHLVRRMGRVSDGDSQLKALNMVRNHWKNSLSIDLIYGYPGSTVKDWLADVEKANQLSINHISLYQLTLEKGTTLYNDLSIKERDLLLQYQDDHWPELLGALENCGYKRYEISNYTKSDISIHNSHYWNMDGWVGIGPGAWSHIPWGDYGLHIENPREVKTFLKSRAVNEWEKYPFKITKSEGKNYMLEILMMGLRHRQGISIGRLNDAGLEISQLLKSLSQFIQAGWIEASDTHIKPTSTGLDFHNTIMLKIMDIVESDEVWKVHC